MAKVSFAKLGLKTSQEIKKINFNEMEIEVKQYLPVNEKLEMIGNIINNSADDNNFSNPVKVNIFTVLEIVERYTNINFTEKQKEDPAKLYDMLTSSGLLADIYATIPEEEYSTIVNDIEVSINAIYTYRNSVMGILDIVTTDYKNLEFDASAIQEHLADPENLALLKSVVSRLG